MTIDLDTLETLPREDLLEAWRQIMDQPPPKGLSSPFLRRFIAFELQVRTQGGLPKGFVARLERAARDLDTGKPAPPALRPGGRLLREWNGVTHVVDVIEGGFLWKGERYRSLSSIAREITGAHWSGPRFFGLTSGAQR